MQAFRANLCACLFMPHLAVSHSISPDLTAAGRARCRPMAFQFRRFKIARTNALRQGPRDNRAALSGPCPGLRASRGA
jgi:hypothetical protein